jgi:rhodanese-related sulfurtransferase
MRVRRTVAAVLILLFALAGCGQPAGRGYHNINAEELHSMLEKDSGLFLADVREPPELEETGVIPGTVNIPLGQVEKRMGEIPRDRVVVLYCRSGRRSAEAAKLLLEKGYEDVYNLEGGILGWSYGLKKQSPR